jgi:adenosine kinase
VNDYEARVVEQKTGKSVQELAAGDRAVIVTRAGEGSSVFAGGQRIDVPAVPPGSVVDPTGCGDAYRSGLLYGMARGWTWRKCAQLASVLGSIKIAHRGGQNHRPARDTIAAAFRSAFGETL